MGLLDFGDRSMLKTKGYRIGVGITQLTTELDKSNGSITPMVNGLVSVLRKELDEFAKITNNLSPKSLSTIEIELNGKKVTYINFIMAVRYFSADLYRITGLKLIDFDDE